MKTSLCSHVDVMQVLLAYFLLIEAGYGGRDRIEAQYQMVFSNSEDISLRA